jgi:hypothetical protein
MPPAPPNRPANEPYHYHVYDFVGSALNPPWGMSLPQAARGNYSFYSLLNDLTNLRAVGAARQVPNIALNAIPGMGALAQTTGAKQTQVLSFGNANAPALAPTVVITGGIHAREWIAAEIAYLVAEYLIVNYPDPAALVPPTLRQAWLRDLVNTRNICIIPMLNPGGNDRTVFGAGADDRMWRKNLRLLPNTPAGWVHAFTLGAGPNPPPFRNVKPKYGLLNWASYDVRDYDPAHNVPGTGIPHYRGHMLYENEQGVDLNRNLATPGWGYDCKPSYNNNAPEGETFFGTQAGGEPESSNLQTAMAAAAALGVGGNLDVAIDYHSYSRAILYPTEWPAGGPTAAHEELGRLLNALIVDSTNNGYQLGTGLDVIKYDATGTVSDRALRSHQARSFTIELDPGRDDPAGFQLDEVHIQAVFETNIRGALAAIAAPVSAAQAHEVYLELDSWPVYTRGNQV